MNIDWKIMNMKNHFFRNNEEKEQVSFSKKFSAVNYSKVPCVDSHQEITTLDTNLVFIQNTNHPHHFLLSIRASTNVHNPHENAILSKYTKLPAKTQNSCPHRPH